jgi:hypothetical protein
MPLPDCSRFQMNFVKRLLLLEELTCLFKQWKLTWTVQLSMPMHLQPSKTLLRLVKTKKH